VKEFAALVLLLVCADKVVELEPVGPEGELPPLPPPQPVRKMLSTPSKEKKLKRTSDTTHQETYKFSSSQDY
jgi:hypothetical protein